MRIRGNCIAALVLCLLLCACESHTHLWTDATCTQPKTCAACGATEGEALGHDWIDAACTQPKTCARCGMIEGEALGHDWMEAACTQPKTCARCGLTEGEALGHDWIDATCTQPKTCARCGMIEGEALGHDWIDATCTQPRICARCGMIEGEALGHDFSDGVCTRCGFVVFRPASGEGNAVIRDVYTGEGVCRVHLYNSGGGNFAFWAYDANGTADLLALGRGAYDGTVLLLGASPFTIEVFSGARWKVDLEELTESETRTFSGKSDAVTDLFAGASGTFRFTYGGENDFVVWLYTSEGETLLVRELGACAVAQTVAIPAGSRAFFAVRADAAWSIEPVEP